MDRHTARLLAGDPTTSETRHEPPHATKSGRRTMEELRLVGVNDDGSRVVLVSQEGTRYTTTIDERLEAAAGADRARLGSWRSSWAPGCVRATSRPASAPGETAEAVATAAGITMERVRRFAGPVIAEREYMAREGAPRRGPSSGSGRDPATPGRHRDRASGRTGHRRRHGVLGCVAARRRAVAGAARGRHRIRTHGDLAVRRRRSQRLRRGRRGTCAVR